MCRRPKIIPKEAALNKSNPDERRESMLSVPARWSELYFNIFTFLCVFFEGIVIYYAITRRPPDADALYVAVNALLFLAAVPMVAALHAYLAMRVRDLIMKTWETFKMERYNKGREDGREDLAREMMSILDKRDPGEGVDALYDFLSKISENGNGKNGRPRN